MPIVASQMRVAFANIALKTGSSSPGDELMTLSTSAVAASRSRASASSRASCSTFVSLLPVARLLRRRAAFGAFPRLNVLRRCVFTVLLPALVRRLIASP
ncbi:MAG: hypothetical protein WB839_07150, partial [Pseudolabrys sp.]